VKLSVRPVTRAEVRAFIEANHSHHHKPNTWLLTVGVEQGGALVCVGVLELPKARMLCNGFTAEVSRVASAGAKHAASMCIMALVRAAVALGYRRLISYMLLGEAGTSYRAAGWHVTALSAGGSWDRPSRPAAQRDSVQRGAKVRWEYGPGAAVRDPEVDATVRAAVGTVELPKRTDELPLFRSAS
jgi:hypothetical protein